MMSHRLVYWPSPVLKKVSVEVETIDSDLIADMKAIMYSHAGVGLSAVQVGELKRVVVTDSFDDNPTVFVNPVINEFCGVRVPQLEGCLSVPGFYEYIMRASEVVVTFRDETFTLHEKIRFSGLQAHVLQHELEHLDGKLYLDHLTSARRSAIMGNIQALRRAGKLK